MVLNQRVYDIDELWELVHQPALDSKHFELIDGVLFEVSPPGARHGQLAIRLGSYLDIFATTMDLGMVTAETGYHPPANRQTLLSPDIAFVSKARLPQPVPDKYVPLMPDLAVEIFSPRETLKRVRTKAEIYLNNDTGLVWIVMPGRQVVEVWRADGGAGIERETLGLGDSLSGEGVLPGFSLELPLLFKQ